MLDLIVEIAGAVAILAAFALNLVRGLDRHGVPYLVLNLAGAALLTVVAARHQLWGFLLLQAVWALVALWGLVGVLRRREPSP